MPCSYRGAAFFWLLGGQGFPCPAIASEPRGTDAGKGARRAPRSGVALAGFWGLWQPSRSVQTHGGGARQRSGGGATTQNAGFAPRAGAGVVGGKPGNHAKHRILCKGATDHARVAPPYGSCFPDFGQRVSIPFCRFPEGENPAEKRVKKRGARRAPFPYLDTLALFPRITLGF